MKFTYQLFTYTLSIQINHDLGIHTLHCPDLTLSCSYYDIEVFQGFMSTLEYATSRSYRRELYIELTKVLEQTYEELYRDGQLDTLRFLNRRRAEETQRYPTT